MEISSQQQHLIGVKTVKVSLKSIQKVIRTVGRIEADEQKQATINTKIEGWIEKLYVDYTGRQREEGGATGGDLQPGASGNTTGISGSFKMEKTTGRQKEG